MASCGIASRRKAEEYILKGLVSVNGEKVTSLSTEIAENDIVLFDGKKINIENEMVYLMLNKPKGYICSVKDEKDRPTVMKLIKEKQRVYPVGRLDYNTEGLLLLTNDGDFANRVVHPSGQIGKTYEVVLKAKPKSEELDQLRKGVMLEDGLTQPAIVSRVVFDDGLYKLNITIFEGKNREVRRMFKAIGYNVFALKRVKIGDLKLGDLPLKQYRKLTQSEIEKIFRRD